MTNPERAQDILQEINDWPVEHAAAAIVRGQEEVASYGDTAQPFALASVSKLLSAYAVLVACEEGAFELDDRVPDSVASAFDTPPTVRELLAHASGVGFAEAVPEKPAQQRRIYSSAGYEILAETITELTGIPFAEYADEALNRTLGMSVEFSGSAGHGFHASVADLEAFAKELLEPRLLSQEMLDEAMQVQFPGLDGIVPGYGRQKPCPWGLGFELFGESGGSAGGADGESGTVKSPHWLGESMPGRITGHFGQSGTFFWVDRETNVAAIVLTDEAFGPWAKDRWAPFNDALWEALG